MVIAPADARIFSAQAFAFANANETAAMSLLGRSEADGGGHTGYNLALTPGARLRGWVEFDGQTLGSNASGATPHFRSRGLAAQAGLDATLGEARRIGIAIAYGQDWFADAAGGKGKNRTIRASLYASQNLGPIGVSAVVSYAHARQTSERETGLGRANARHGLNQLVGGVQAVLPVQIRGATLTPAIGVLASRLSGGDFAEGGSVPADFRLTVHMATKTYVSPFANLQFAYPVVAANGVVWTPDAQLGYRRSAAGAGNAFDLTAADGTAFNGNRVDLDKSSLTAGLSLSAHKGAWTAFVQYRGQFTQHWSDNRAVLGLRLAL